MVRRARWIFPALACALIIVFYTSPAVDTPNTPSLRMAAGAALGVLAASVMTWAAIVRRPARRPAWVLLVAAVLVITVGMVWYASLGAHPASYPTAPDVFTLAAYPLLAVGLMWLGMARSRSRDWASMIDFVALSLAVTVIAWITLIRPTVDAMELTGSGKIVGVSSGVGIAVVFVAAVRMVGVWWRNLGGLLLGAAFAALIVTDLLYSAEIIDRTRHSGGPIDLGILLFFALCGCAALLPPIAPHGTIREIHNRGVGQLVALTVALLVAPTALIVQAEPGPVRSPLAIAAGAALVGLLGMLRLIGTVRDRRRTLVREATVRRASRAMGLAISPDDVTESLEAALAELAVGPTDVRITFEHGETPPPDGVVPDPSIVVHIGEPEARGPQPVARGATVTPRPESTSGSEPTSGSESTSDSADRPPAGAVPARRRSDDAELRISVAGGTNTPGAGAACDVVFAAPDAELAELSDVLAGLADQASIALQRIDLVARIRASEKEQDVLAYRASHDGLTGLVNSTLFRDELSAARAAASDGHVTSVLFVDLDDFKSINDTLGHEIGDAVLVISAQRIRSCLRREDIGARLGGDEFAVLLRGLTDDAAAQTVARRIVAALAEPARAAGIPVDCTGSVGLASATAAAEYDDLLRRADIALYAAKAAGKGRWRPYQTEMRSPLRRGSDLRAELDATLRHGNGGLELYYQPIVALADGALRGFEALIRWQHPVYGPIPVADLISVAEHTGLILPLGDWVLAHALADAVRLGASGGAGGPYVSVNVSAAQLRQPDYADRIRGHLSTAGLDPAALVVEITESQLLHDDERLWQDLSSLRKQGVRIAIDDYGTGYSQLGYLRHPVFDVVKADKSFLDNIADARPQTLFRAMLRLTLDLDLDLIAEGVEDEATRAILIGLGARFAQGHLFAPAMPLDAALRWMAARRAPSS